MQKGGRQGEGGGSVGREREDWRRFFTGQYFQSAKKVGGIRDGGKRLRRSKGRYLKEEKKSKEKDEKVDVHNIRRMKIG
jgi:hypothetical protein